MDWTFLNGLIIGLTSAILLFLFLAWLLIKHMATKMFSVWVEKKLDSEVAKSLQIQRSVIKGKISEQLLPLLSDRIGDLSDLRFVGDPVDYIYFKGLSEAREGSSKKVDIKILEVKTGGAKLSLPEELVKDAVKGNRVDWEEIRL